ncbi:class I SAM-dependent methyltransferase [Rhizobium sp. CFBP 8752]|uniref:class I SAM-dependent methyltransferase n=1 Tax=Rhizobium sp. CFBP 8752 TaxID=2775301 RepID=UPI001780B1E6|nr:class I SAM-dependent methyltransferase [Rhizobium sp. CFBP 8752]MBD8664965.1 class I SAM-dependent methyltransferase [Rhizobium sp. CFBP 8752]
MAEHDQTLRFYADNAKAYAGYREKANEIRLEAFLSRLSPGARVLELGCGNGRDSGFMIERGFDVTPTDGVAEMAEQASRRLGRTVAVLRFGDIASVAAYDGVWANACLLHTPINDLADILARIHRALRPGGIFYASYKTGGEEMTDAIGRYYNNPSRPWLEQAYRTVTWSSLEISTNDGSGYDDRPTEWLHVTAVKA